MGVKEGSSHIGNLALDELKVTNGHTKLLTRVDVTATASAQEAGRMLALQQYARVKHV
jgi:hypothetical protein